MQHDPTDSTDASLSECGHDRFERNHYFHGKLMTARDMAAEQAYHVGQRRAHARSVAGSGVAWGLETSVRDDDDAVVVAVERGYAIDECGRPVVVPQRREKTITDATTVNAPALSVYVRYEACLKESVPIDGAETACEDECAYNRVLEVSDIEVEAGDGGDAAPKRVEPVEFPDWDDLQSVSEADREVPGPTDHGLATIAESYRAAAPDETGADDDMRLYLGTFTPGTNDPWVRDETRPTPFVYSNDMLYAATARHAADFANPHEVSLTSRGRADENAAAVHVRDDGSTRPEVTLSGSDGSVDVTHHDADGRIDLSVEAYVEELVEERVAPLERHAAEKSLKYKALVFRRAADRFDDPAGTTAGEIAELARRAVDTRLDPDGASLELRDDDGDVREEIDPENYEALLTQLLAMEQEFRAQVAGQVTDVSYERLSDALGGLKTALTPAEPDTLELGDAQDDVVDAVEWLEPVDDDSDEPEGSGEATFTDGGTFEQERGDIAEIGIQLEDTNAATLRVGGSEVGYESTVTVQSGGDDRVTVRMNTYLAGTEAGAESRAFGTAQPSDSATATLNTSELSGVLDAGTYELALSVDGEETDVGSLSLSARSTDSLVAHHGPANVYDTLTDAGSVLGVISEGTVSPQGRVSPGETVVSEVAATGIYGAIAGEFGDRTDVDPRGLKGLDGLLELSVAQTDAEEATPKRLALWESVERGTAKLFAEPSADRLLLAVDTGEAVFTGGRSSTAGPAANESYEVAFEVAGNSGLAGSTERVADTFDMAELIVRVPDIEGTSYSQASMELEEAQLSPNPTYREIDSREYLTGATTYNRVVEQQPDPGTSVEAGSEVRVTVLTSRSVDDVITGVGPNFADRLEDLGYGYIHELEDANAAELERDIPGASEEQIQSWIDQAQRERLAVELSLREGTSIDQSRNVARAFVESGQTNVAAMNDDQIQRIITRGTQNRLIDPGMAENFLANSTNLNLTTDGTTFGPDDVLF